MITELLIGENWHTHDQVNEFVYHYRCSLGHEFSNQYTGRSCWCNWLPPEQQVVRDAEDLEDDGIITTDVFGSWD